MFDQEFCTYLEYQISRALSASADVCKSKCWCDGVLIPHLADDYSFQKVNNTKKIVTKAWMGESGQDLYALTINFGRKSVRYYSRGNKLHNCVPATTDDGWITLDIENRAAAVELL